LASCFSCGVARAEIDDASQKIPMFSITTTLSLRSRPLADIATLFPWKLSEVLTSHMMVRFAALIDADESMSKWHMDESKATLDHELQLSTRSALPLER